MFDLTWPCLGRVTILFILASFRSSVAVLATLVFTALSKSSLLPRSIQPAVRDLMFAGFLTLGIYQFVGNDHARVAGGVFGFLATAVSSRFPSSILGPALRSLTDRVVGGNVRVLDSGTYYACKDQRSTS